MKLSTHHGRQAGFTIIEVAIVATILALIFAAIGTFQATSAKSSSAMIARSDIERDGDRAMRAIMDELRDAGVHTLEPDPTSAFATNTITFRRPSSIAANGDVTFGSQSRLDIRMDDGEVDNGIDDDGDGVIDERALVITHDVALGTQRSATICHGIAERLEGESANAADDNGNGIIDESGFCVRRVGDLFFLYVTLEGRMRTGELIQYTTTTAIALHN